MPAIASFKDVSHRNGNYQVLEDVSFSLDRDTITTLIGPNGAGKTTIAKLLLKISKPSSGSVTNNAKKLGYVPQKIALNSDLPLNCEMFLKLISPAFKKGFLAKELLAFASFDELKEEKLENLSGGQLQRLMLAGSILNEPELLVLDEPNQSLDIDGQEEFYSILSRLKKSGKTTIFIISHDLFTVMKKSDQVLCLNHHLCCKGRPTHTIVKGSENIGLYNHVHDHKHH